jgi:putative ABC transport system permease protein
VKYLPLVLRNLFRNKRRSGLTAFAVAISVFLVVVLRTALHHLETPPSEQSQFRLVAHHAASLQNPLPEGHVEKVRAVPGVLRATPMTWFGGYWKRFENFFANFEIDASTWWDVFPEQRLPEDQKRGFLADPQGCFVGRALSEEYGWKIGDRIVLTGTLYPLDPELNVQGIYEGPDSTWLLFHRKYAEESLGRPGRVGTIWFLVAGAADVGPVSERVDARFRNSDAETKTETEKSFQLSFVEMMGDVRAIVRWVVGFVALTMLLVAGNAMAMAARERLQEAAVLRALGFPPARVATLLLAEAMLVAGLGGAIGTALPVLLFWNFTPQPIWFPTFRVPTEIGLTGFGFALALGLLAGGLPSWGLVRRPIAQALRRA